MEPTKQSPRSPVLSDHRRVGKKFIPPFVATLGTLSEVSWVDDILPELLWLGILIWKLRSFFVRGGLKSHLVHADKVNIMTLEAFVALANRGEL